MKSYYVECIDIYHTMYLYVPMGEKVRIDEIPSSGVYEIIYRNYREVGLLSNLPMLWKYFKKSPSQEICEHVWKNYIGFTENYDYCEKCDEKKKINLY